MFVAAGKVILDFYNNDDLREKRRHLGELVQTIHQKFNASASEVADFDDTERCVIGLALVASTEPSARAALKKILDHIDSNAFARVVVEDTDVFAYD